MAFDYRTSIINSKGKVIATQDYNLRIDGGTRKMERPPGSGIWYDESGDLTKESADKMNAQAELNMDVIVSGLTAPKVEDEQKASTDTLKKAQSQKDASK